MRGPGSPAQHGDGDPIAAAVSPPPSATDSSPVHAVGVGPGSPEHLTKRAAELVADAEVLVGFDAVLDVVRNMSNADLLTCEYEDQEATLAAFANRVQSGESGVAAFAGDPNVSGYQFLGRIERAVEAPVKVVPGVSSVQIAAARARTPLEHSTIISLHRRGDLDGPLDRLATAARQEHVICLPRPGDWSVTQIANFLEQQDISADRPAVVLEELTLPAERVTRSSVGALAAMNAEFSRLSILVVRADDPTPVTRSLSMEDP